MKKDRVVCTTDSWALVPTGSTAPFPTVHPAKGDIVTVMEVFEDLYYHLQEFPDALYNMNNFRPVDDTFGEVMAEIIEKQVEVEEMEKISV